MNRKIIALLIVWLCIGFNSVTDLADFLSAPKTLTAAEARSAKVIAMPASAPSPVPAFEIIFPSSAAVVSLPQNAVECP